MTTATQDEMSFEKSIQETFLMKEATSIQHRSFTCAGLLIKMR